jgi:hypothetical protein
MSALPPKADIDPQPFEVCLMPTADIKAGSLNPIKTDALFRLR